MGRSPEPERAVNNETSPDSVSRKQRDLGRTEHPIDPTQSAPESLVWVPSPSHAGRSQYLVSRQRLFRLADVVAWLCHHDRRRRCVFYSWLGCRLVCILGRNRRSDWSDCGPCSELPLPSETDGRKEVGLGQPFAVSGRSAWLPLAFDQHARRLDRHRVQPLDRRRHVRQPSAHQRRTRPRAARHDDSGPSRWS